MVVENDRVPFLVDQPGEVPGFLQVSQVGVAVVVMSGIIVIKVGQGRYFKRGAHVLVVPLGQQVHAVRVGEHQETDDFIQDFNGLFIAG